MHMKKNVMLFSILFILTLILSSCTTVKIHDSKACTVAGVISAGADCGTILSEQRSEMTMPEFIEWLEPNEHRAGAICESTEDWVEQKKALEQACQILGPECSKDLKNQIQKASKNVDSLLGEWHDPN